MEFHGYSQVGIESLSENSKSMASATEAVPRRNSAIPTHTLELRGEIDAARDRRLGWVADGPSAIKIKGVAFRGLTVFQDPKIIGH